MSWTAEVLEGTARERFEATLAARDIAIPLYSRSHAAGLFGGKSWFIGARDPSGEAAWGCAVEVHSTRALPGYRILRARQFGHGAPEGALAPILGVLQEVGRKRRVLRIDVDAYALEPGALEDLGAKLERHGFLLEPSHRTYTSTILIDLRPTPEELLASFHATCRRHIRAAAKKSVAVQPITDISLAPRLEDLGQETMARTGGSYSHPEWRDLIEFCQRHPVDARLLGVFRTDTVGPDALLAYVVGYNHGDVAEYGIAASTRRTDVKMPLLYAPTWDLMLWAKEQGARLFDFGGVTAGSEGSGDPLGGISDFKRYFATLVTKVGAEFRFEPSPLRTAAAAATRGAARRLLALLGRSSE